MTKVSKKTWEVAQEWEFGWHGDFINSFHEEEKQLLYAEKMGLVRSPDNKTPYRFDLKGKSILDIGGGAYSLLLKCVNFERMYEGSSEMGTAVIDPLMDKYPQWVKDRYKESGIFCKAMTGEDMNNESEQHFDEVWIYNVLEHTYDPKKIIENALEISKVVRIFEWLDTPPNIGHPQTLTEKDLNNWLGGEGKVEVLNRNGVVGKCFYGVFKGSKYETTSSNRL